MNAETYKLQQCFWEGGRLVIVTESRRVDLPSSEGIKALKTNCWTVPDGSDGGEERMLFEPDDPRRMALIQERISSLRD